MPAPGEHHRSHQPRHPLQAKIVEVVPDKTSTPRWRTARTGRHQHHRPTASGASAGRPETTNQSSPSCAASAGKAAPRSAWTASSPPASRPVPGRGNVKDTPLAELFAGRAWRENAGLRPRNGRGSRPAPRATATTASRRGSPRRTGNPDAAQLAADVRTPRRGGGPRRRRPRHCSYPAGGPGQNPGLGLWHDVWELRDGPASPPHWLAPPTATGRSITRVGAAARRPRRPRRPTRGAAHLLCHPARPAGRRCTGSRSSATARTSSTSGPAQATVPRCYAIALGDRHVTSVDVDEYLTKAATERLDSIGMQAQVDAVDATGPLPGAYDRIVSTVAVRPIPASWLAALRPGGRLVTTITGTSLIVTADKTPDGGASGRTEWDRAGSCTPAPAPPTRPTR